LKYIKNAERGFIMGQIGYMNYRETSPNEGIKNKKEAALFALSQMYDIDFFCFNPAQINIENKTINGWFWDRQNKRFVQKETPYPKIIDDIGFDGKIFKTQNPSLYNELAKYSYMLHTAIGAKFTVYTMLKTTKAAKWLIETRHYKNISFPQTLAKHKSLIAKPENDTGGRGVMKVTLLDSGNYEVRSGREQSVVTPEEFKAAHHKAFRDNYIVQPYINSVTNLGAPFDVRLHIRRGEGGEWNHGIFFPRIGNAAGVVSNRVKMPGSTISTNLKEWLSAEFPGDYERIYRELMEAASTVPQETQRFVPKIIQSIGLDVGIDRADGNRLKFFEVNSGPGHGVWDFNAAESTIHFYMFMLDALKKRE
jgi:hypothetical protein